jgi:hypothetical protein
MRMDACPKPNGCLILATPYAVPPQAECGGASSFLISQDHHTVIPDVIQDDSGMVGLWLQARAIRVTPPM